MWWRRVCWAAKHATSQTRLACSALTIVRVSAASRASSFKSLHLPELDTFYTNPDGKPKHVQHIVFTSLCHKAVTNPELRQSHESLKCETMSSVLKMGTRKGSERGPINAQSGSVCTSAVSMMHCRRRTGEPPWRRHSPRASAPPPLCHSPSILSHLTILPLPRRHSRRRQSPSVPQSCRLPMMISAPCRQ